MPDKGHSDPWPVLEILRALRRGTSGVVTYGGLAGRLVRSAFRGVLRRLWLAPADLRRRLSSINHLKRRPASCAFAVPSPLQLTGPPLD